MDLLTNYHGFKEDILSTFKDLIDEFGLELLEPFEGDYLLVGKWCVLRFTYDRGQIGCAFKQITDDALNPGYLVWSVYNYLYPIKQTTVENKNSDWGAPKQQLAGWSDIIKAHLKNVLNGDFSWLDNYTKVQGREEQLTLFTLGLDRADPIQKKFWAGDPSWIKDAEIRMRENSTAQEVTQGSSIIEKVLNKLKGSFR